LASAVGACNRAAPPSALVASVREVGTIPNPPGASGRDLGLSILFGGHSVWVFGDTFLGETAADGYRWRSSTWSWTDDLNAADGLDGWIHALGPDRKPLQLLRHSVRERSFNDAHNGSPCPAGSNCGARHTPWPAALALDPVSGHAFVFYTNEETEPTSAFAFHSTGTSIAIWSDPARPTDRPVASGEMEPAVLFGAAEPPWGSAAFIEGGLLYAYACSVGRLAVPCRVAHVAVQRALDRASWTFWNGMMWVADWKASVDLFDGAPGMTVHFSRHLNRYLAVYMVPLGSTMAFRTAEHPWGPWSGVEILGQAKPSLDPKGWDYSLVAHPELAKDGGRIEYLTYYQPGRFLDGVIHIVEVTFR
jgi:hypothetical protein